ncbi:hypothetical protein EMIT0P74_120208 [Pseudomonas sp. IT-P74]
MATTAKLVALARNALYLAHPKKGATRAPKTASNQGSKKEAVTAWSANALNRGRQH